MIDITKARLKALSISISLKEIFESDTIQDYDIICALGAQSTRLKMLIKILENQVRCSSPPISDVVESFIEINEERNNLNLAIKKHYEPLLTKAGKSKDRIDLPNVTTIGNDTFSYNSLTSLDPPNDCVRGY